jgi:hypothetical protein
MLESLETRRFLSAAATATQSGGVLDIKGGADGGAIRVIEDNHTVTVEFNGTAPVASYSGVTAINITGQAKNDQIFYTGNSVGANIKAGGGTDEIVINDHGTAGSYASGDGDADDLVVLDANNTTLVGDGGNDTLYVSDAVDISKHIHLYGMGGADFFNVSGGTNYIYGGGGRDSLVTNGVEGVDFAIVVLDSVESIGSIP